MPQWLVGTDLVNAGRIGRAFAAFLFIFGVYVLGSLTLRPPLELIFSEPSAPWPSSPASASGEIQDLGIWWAFALLGVVLALGAAIWCVRLLARYCPRPIFVRALILFGLFSLLAAVLAHREGNAMVALSQSYACPDAQSLFCQTPEAPAFGDYFFRDRPIGDAAAGRAVFARHFTAMKSLLNIVLQMAAIFVLGSMLLITALCFQEEQKSGEFFERLAADRVMPRLFIAAGAILSIVTLTDLLFTNWPINALGEDTDAGRGLAGLLTVLIFYYAVLGSIILALALLCARWLALTPLPLFTATNGGKAETMIGKISAFLFRKSTVNALVTLSPVLTVLLANPLVKQIVDILPAG